MILSFHCAHNSVQGIGGEHGEPQDADLPMDVARREVRHTSGEGTQMQGERGTNMTSGGQQNGGDGDLHQIYILQ
jgi:hypothetical protein